jgi:hypothetical protein
MPPKATQTPQKQEVSACCFGCSACFLVAGAIFVGVGSGICSLSVNRSPCCDGTSLCDGSSGTGTNSFGPCGGGLADDDASFNSGLCGFSCGSSSTAQCSNQVYSCNDPGSFTTTCVAASTCCTNHTASDLLITGAVFMVVFGISLCCMLLLLCKGWKFDTAGKGNPTLASQDTLPVVVTNAAPAVPVAVATPIQKVPGRQDSL